MNRLKKAALLTKLIGELQQHGSWCGETHIQKATFFLQDLCHVPLDYDFILYKHGPFSFDLRDDLTAMRADELLILEPQTPPYGPRMKPADQARTLQDLYPTTMRKFSNSLDYIARELGDKGVVELERLSTALYVTLYEQPDKTVEERAEHLCLLKPHIPLEEGLVATQKVDGMIQDIKRPAAR